jgi:predicted nucleic acid-binding protein
LSVVDANVWIAAFLDRDAFHGRSRRWLSDEISRGHELVIPATTLAEVGGSMSRRVGQGLADRALADLLSTPALEIVSLSSDFATNAGLLAARLALRGMDAIYVTLALQRREPLVTWDDDILTRAEGTIVVTTPA